ncbi:glycosyltransferase family 2 protein [Thalassovita gelatinovora]|uniref:glycosyltransferase family 2 protein n=1 Tax=Thalassovita gelatinovora TaxID=53501 RepID=UPI00130DFCFF|nr:glycosyltransferase family 2 protein [Thalassovita gelatinovora]QIZ81387.1 glycosyltransferase [Thalassovita gelatinovora]
MIIPVYGTERYIEKCVRSVMEQTFEDIEILCIDDCSPDNSAAIIERLAAEDKRIRLIRHDRNLGLGGARNTGISEARAPYLASVDSDDYIDPSMLERLWDATDGQTVDIVSCGFALVNEDGSLMKKTEKPEQTFYNEHGQVNILDLLPSAFWNKLWRTRLFTDNNITFPNHLYFEDLATTPRVLHFAQRIRSIPDPLYNYMIRETSITNTFGAKHIIDYFRVYDVLWAFLSDEGLFGRYQYEFIEKIGKTLHFHTEAVLASDMSEADQTQYLRYLLLLKIAYLEYNSTLRELDTDSLRSLLLTARSWEDVEALTGSS